MITHLLPPSWGRIVLAVVAAIAVSIVFEPVLAVVFPTAPAIPLCVVLAVGACNGPLFGVAAGMIAGLIVDFLGAGAIGVNLFAMALVGFLAGRLVRLTPPWPDALRVAIASPLVFAYVPATWLFARIAGTPAPMSLRFSGAPSPAAFLVMNLSCAVLVSPFLSALRPRN